MGKVKDLITKQDDGSSQYALKEEEFNYIMNINVARQNVNNEYNRVMSAFLHYIAASRLGYSTTENLKFEIDFDNPEKMLKVWRIDEKDLFTAEGQKAE